MRPTDNALMPFPYLKTILSAIALIAVTILAYSAPPEGFDGGWLAAMGRGHPVLLHFPIGLLAAVVLAELVHFRQGAKDSRTILGYLLAATFASTLAVVVCGVLLSWEGGYHEETLSDHSLGGLVVAYLAGIAYIFAPLGAKSHRILYKGSLATALVAMMYTGHHGGSLTHGSDFLTEHLPFGSKSDSQEGPQLAEGELPTIFDQAILPSLDTYCIRCHGPEKDKGDLRLDTIEAMLAGGEIGEAVVPHDSKASLLIEFMEVPLDDDDHMPPEGKLQPEEDLIALLTWWIDSGASTTATIEDLTPPDSIAHFFALPDAIEMLPRDTIESLLAANTASLSPFTIEFLDTSENQLSVVSAKATDSDIESLNPIMSNIVTLDLKGSSVGDAAIDTISQFLNLNELRLAGTQITDQGAVNLNKLQELQALDLANTAIGDDALSSFAALKSLKSLNLKGTDATAKAAAILEKRLFPTDHAETLQDEIEAIHQKIGSLGLTVETSEKEK